MNDIGQVNMKFYEANKGKDSVGNTDNKDGYI